MDGEKGRPNRLNGLVLEVLRQGEFTAAEVGAKLKIGRDQINKVIRRLRQAGVAWRGDGKKPVGCGTGQKMVDTWTAYSPNDPLAGITYRQPNDEARARATQAAARTLRFRATDFSAEVAWVNPKPLDPVDDWLSDALELWADWMRRKDFRALDYPPECTVLVGGWLVRESEELYEAADMRLILATDAAVESLPGRERAAIWTAYSLCESKEGDWIVDALQYARLCVLRHLQKKGFG